VRVTSNEDGAFNLRKQFMPINNNEGKFNLNVAALMFNQDLTESLVFPLLKSRQHDLNKICIEIEIKCYKVTKTL